MPLPYPAPPSSVPRGVANATSLKPLEKDGNCLQLRGGYQVPIKALAVVNASGQWPPHLGEGVTAKDEELSCRDSRGRAASLVRSGDLAGAALPSLIFNVFVVGSGWSRDSNSLAGAPEASWV